MNVAAHGAWPAPATRSARWLPIYNIVLHMKTPHEDCHWVQKTQGRWAVGHRAGHDDPASAQGNKERKKARAQRRMGKKRPKGKCINTSHTRKEKSRTMGPFYNAPFLHFLFYFFFSLFSLGRAALSLWREGAHIEESAARGSGRFSRVDRPHVAGTGRQNEGKKRTQHAHGRRARTRWAARNSIGCWCPRRACRRAAGPPQAPLSAR